jgi:hypothetical protein
MASLDQFQLITIKTREIAMIMKPLFTAVAVGLVSLCVNAAEVVPTEIEQPGTQPREVGSFESPNRCDNCPAGYDATNPEYEPATGWRGAAMGNAGRDPIFWATVAIAEQDFDGSGDLCIRCHSAAGWYAGRSTPTDGSGLAAGDDDGIDCDTCHTLTNPDDSEHLGVMNSPYIANCAPDPNVPTKSCEVPGEGFYGSGMASIWGGSDKLGPYDDADARHQWMQSGFHRSVDFCGTCHDVSNPAVGDLAQNNGAQSTAPGVVSSQDFHGGAPNIGGPVEEKAAFNNPPYSYGIVERTFSEYKSSAFPTTLVSGFSSLPADLQVAGGSLETAYQAAMLAGTGGNYEDGSPRYFSCQTCHMRPVIGEGANKNGVRTRPDLPLHDQTGGNYWFKDMVEYQDARGMLRLGGGLSSTQITAMNYGQQRAVVHLQQAASLDVTGNTLKVINLTGHKLISGYPEGRRMWLNIKWYDGNDDLLHEDGKYGPIGAMVTNPADGSTVEAESIIDLDNTIIYEAHYAMTQDWAERLIGVGYASDLPLSFDRVTGLVDYTLGDLAGQPPGTYHETFHFVLNNYIAKDNRIPPYGMRYDEAMKRNALPVPADQYNGQPGGVYNYWDEIDLNALAPAGALRAQIRLLYQGTSWEYVQFLDRANTGQNVFLADEGVNMLEAWINAEVPVAMEVGGDRKMVPPVVMATAAWPDNSAPVAGDDSYATDQDAVLNISAPGVLGNDTDPEGGTLSAVLVSGPANGVLLLNSDGSFTYTPDAGFSGVDGFSYQAHDDAGLASNTAVVTITVTATGGGTQAGVSSMLTGLLSGKGKNQVFAETTLFAQGDEIIIRMIVSDSSGNPVPDATVTVDIAGPESRSLTSSPSGADGTAEASWNTSTPNRKGQGGTPTGDYTATTGDVSATGYTWDGIATSTGFTIQ